MLKENYFTIKNGFYQVMPAFKVGLFDYCAKHAVVSYFNWFGYSNTFVFTIDWN
jgi:hypothetical protein